MASPSNRSVRAYDVGAVAGDRGYTATAEVRRDLGLRWKTQWQAVAFADGAEVTLNRDPWTTGINRVGISGGGVGLNFAAPKNWSGRISIATRIGGAPASLQGSAATRGWAEISRSF